MPRGIWGLANPDANGTAVPDYAIPDPDADPENAALQPGIHDRDLDGDGRTFEEISQERKGAE